MSKYKPAKKIFDKNGKEIFPHLHERPLLSRRDLLGAGIISFAAAMTLPSLLDLLLSSNAAYAKDIGCPVGNTTGLIPLITLNLSGGAALSANWLPMDKGMQLLPSYDKMGLGNPSNLTVEKIMGANFAGGGVSKFLTGLKAAAPTALLKTSFVGVPVQSRDDSGANKFDITGMAAKAGYAGGMLPNLGRQNTPTGTKNDFAYVKPPTPLAVGSFNDLASALGVAGSLSQLNDSQKTRMFKMIQDLNSAQSRTLAAASGGSEMGLLVECASQNNHKMSSQSSGAISPLANAAFAAIWGINNNTAANSQSMVFASMVYNALKGNAGTVNLEIGGYDYHNNTRTTGDQKDQEAGTVVGQILESAALLKTKVFIVVTSDGAVSSAVSSANTSPWVSDRGSAGSAYMLGFDPKQAPETSGSQLGRFTVGQTADETFLTGSSPELAAAGIFANYLSFSSRLQLFEPTLPRVFSAAQLEQVLRFRS
jgi:hypothetical protein